MGRESNSASPGNPFVASAVGAFQIISGKRAEGPDAFVLPEASGRSSLSPGERAGVRASVEPFSHSVVLEGGLVKIIEETHFQMLLLFPSAFPPSSRRLQDQGDGPVNAFPNRRLLFQLLAA